MNHLCHLILLKDKIKLESVNFRGDIVGTATVTPVSRAGEGGEESNATATES